jgi:hypothetical protein
MAAYDHFATATGDVPGTPGIVNQQQPGAVVDPYAAIPQQVLQWLAGISAMAGAKAGGATSTDQAQAGFEASKAPLAVPVEAAKSAGKGLLDMTGLQQWAQTQGRIVGIYGVLLIVGIIGLVFLLSSAGVSVGPVKVGK